MSATTRKLSLTCGFLVLLACGGTSGAPDASDANEAGTPELHETEDARQDPTGNDTVEAQEDALYDLGAEADAGSDVEAVDLPAEEADEHPCSTEAECTDREACAEWPDHGTGRCVEACVDACPDGLGLQGHDGCHCRVEPVSSVRVPFVPSEWCTPPVPAPPVLPFDGRLRLVDQGDGTVLDSRSGRLWTRSPAAIVATLAEAAPACATLTLAGATWRLPTVDELLGVYDLESEGWPPPTFTSPEPNTKRAATLQAGDAKAFAVGSSAGGFLVTESVTAYQALAPLCVQAQEGPGPSNDRFVTLLDATIADRVTGLAWGLPEGEATTSGVDADEICAAKGPGWRAPSVKELALLKRPSASPTGCPLVPARLGLSCPLPPFASGSHLRWQCDERILVQLSPPEGQWLRVEIASATTPAAILCVRPLADGDGVASAADDCPGIPDPDQADHDGDGLGWACDPDDFGQSVPDDPCSDVACGVADFGGWASWSCGACPEGLVCDTGACIAVTCASDADCQADANALPGGTLRRCNLATHACELGFDDHAEVLDLMQRIYRGAAVYYSRTDRLTQEATPLPCQFPASQGITPIEGTCCAAQGGPDKDNDELCDADPGVWNDAGWSSLGVHVGEPHAFVYSFSSEGTLGTARFTASAFGDQDCDSLENVFQVVSSLPAGEPCHLAAPAGVTLAPEGSVASALAVHLTAAQQAAFLPPAGLASLNPHHDEVSSNLAAIVAGAVAAYEAHAAGDCAFPEAPATPDPTGSWSPTCCLWPAWPDTTVEILCPPNPSAWETPAWQALGFSIPGAHAFVYRADWDPTSGLLRASAHGDLDCDTFQSTFVRFARPVAGSEGCDAEVVPGVYIDNETE